MSLKCRPATKLLASRNSRYAFLGDGCSLPKYLSLQKNLPVHTPGDSQDLLLLGAGSKISRYCLTLIVVHLLTEWGLLISLSNLIIAQTHSFTPAALPSCISLTFRTSLWSITNLVFCPRFVLLTHKYCKRIIFSQSIYFQLSV